MVEPSMLGPCPGVLVASSTAPVCGGSARVAGPALVGVWNGLLVVPGWGMGVARCWALRNQAPAHGGAGGCWFSCGCLVVG